MVTLTRPKPTLPQRRARSSMIPTITLAFWRVRETWQLLTMAALGVLIAVVLICAVPLFSSVSLTAGLRSVLNTSPLDSEVFLSTSARALSDQIFTRYINQPLQAFIHQQLGTYISKPPEFIVQAPGLDIVTTDPNKQGDEMTLLGFDMQQAASHAKVLVGQLPQARSADLQIAINQQTAEALQVTVGSVISLRFFFLPGTNGPEIPIPATFTLHITGIFEPTFDDLFWQGYDFDPSPLGNFISYKALMSTSTYLSILTQLGANAGGDGVYFIQGQEPYLNWYYYLDANRISINDLDPLINRLASTQLQISNAYNSSAYYEGTQISGPALESYSAPSTLERFRDRVSVATIPADILAIQVLALVLFFISMIADLIVERQTAVIALLRSRGASRQHIFGSFVTQSVGIGIIALLAGPLLAIPVIRILGQRLLAPADQNALNVLDGNPLPIAWSVRWFALAAAACAVFTMILAVRSSANQDVLVLRREAARSTHRSLWRRLNLDIIFIIIALVGFGLSLYVTNSGALDIRSNLLISTPLALVAPVLLVMAGILLFLRFFPLLLRFSAWLASRRPSAPSVIAIAQMARAPRQATRMILLLALASSFGIFTLIFNASQEQQAYSITAYQAGADFSGTIPESPTPQPSLANQTAAYRRLPGVTAASLGYSGQALPSGTNQDFTIEFRAVDTSTYAQTAIWTQQDSDQPLDSLMKELAQKSRTSAEIPAIVDALTWKALDLSNEPIFLMSPPDATQFLTFVAIAEVQHIPTVNDSLASGGTSDYNPPGGVIVDYQTFARAFQATTNIAVPRNQVWLRTTDDPAALKNIRAALNKGPLALKSVYDRRVMLAQAQSNPLYINLVGILTLGAITAIFLALAGNLITSWLSAKSRLTSFALLRALGSTPAQLARMLITEQSIVYGCAIALGIIFGGLLAATVVPTLVFSSIPQSPNMSNGEFYVLQRVLPVTLVMPASLLIALALLVLLCIIALGMMARIASKPSISQTLRLNED